jgi:hypothetical protein
MKSEKLKVEKNYLKLNSFLQLLKQLLSEGKEIAITIKGYASPLNSSDYNLNLSKRRVQSLVNLLYEFEGGVFVPYIDGKATNGAKLIIKREAYGENMVAQGVSDNLHDLRNSVYSPAAAKERKIAVIARKFTLENSPIKFRNYITYSIKENLSEEKIVDNNFYVSTVYDMNVHAFNGDTTSSSFCNYLGIKNNVIDYVYPYKKDNSFYMMIHKSSTR